MQQDQIQAPPTALARRPENPSPVSRAPGPGEIAAPAKPAPAATAAPRARSPRRFILPLVLVAGLGYGAHLAYDWFVEGRFLVSTDDAYVGADMAIIAAKVSGHVDRGRRRRRTRPCTPAISWCGSTMATTS